MWRKEEEERDLSLFHTEAELSDTCGSSSQELAGGRDGWGRDRDQGQDLCGWVGGGGWRPRSGELRGPPPRRRIGSHHTSRLSI